MLPRIQIDDRSTVPKYRQLFEQLRAAILDGRLEDAEQLPPTRELAGKLGLNRATISAAYALLESEGYLRGHVGRGSFVAAPPSTARVNWDDLMPPEDGLNFKLPEAAISFAASRPSEVLFPLEEFRAACRQVIDEEAAAILQLGATPGYPPLRKYLMAEARAKGVAGPDDDILITNGCQQAFDLIQRVLASRGETVLLEDPVYPGLRNVFLRGGARVVGIPVGLNGLDVSHFARLVERERPRLIVLTPNFQNPTGTTLGPGERAAIVKMARDGGAVIVENDLYGELRYEGEPLAPLKQIDTSGGTILLRSFSKIAFPGLRVGWAIGPRQVIARLAEAKQWSDLHTDQLSQAVLLRFALSGSLDAHRTKMIAAGTERLRATLSACERELPKGARWTRPEGGMNLWVRLPEPLDTSNLLPRALAAGVSYLPGKYFAVSRSEAESLRISFAGLAPEKIRAGLAVLGNLFTTDLERLRAASREEPAPALV